MGGALHKNCNANRNYNEECTFDSGRKELISDIYNWDKI